MRSILGTIIDRSPLHIGTSESPFDGMFATERLTNKGRLALMEHQSTVFPIVDRLASSVAAVKWRLYRTSSGNGKGDLVERHPALTIWNKPNRIETGAQFRERFMQHYELTGEWWWIVARNAAVTLPLEMWAVRPDRMAPIKHATKFIAGYTYSNGVEDVPLGTDEVIYGMRPNPMNPYRGIGPLGSLVLDIDGEAAAAEYNMQFFRNGAEPGGMIKTKAPLSDAEFDKLLKRWRLSHRGVSNAHRVGILEGGYEWEQRAYTMRDMQFEQMRRFSREQIRNAWGFPKALLGDVEDVNRANAEAATVVFANWLLVPRLNRIREQLNDDFLPMFGSLGDNLEFDYESPTPPDKVDDRADLTARIQGASTLIAAGFDRAAVLEALDLPAIAVAAPPPGDMVAP